MIGTREHDDTWLEQVTAADATEYDDLENVLILRVNLKVHNKK